MLHEDDCWHETNLFKWLATTLMYKLRQISCNDQSIVHYQVYGFVIWIRRVYVPITR